MGFFKRVKTAIVNFEDYQQFANEKLSKAIKYFLQIVLIFVLCAAISVVVPLVNTVRDSVEYMKTEIPEFSIKDNTLTIESDNPVSVKNEETSLLIYADTSIEKIDVNAFFEENKEFNNILLFTTNEFYVKIINATGVVTYNYNTVTQTIGVSELTKQGIIDYFADSGYISLFSALFLFVFAYLLLTYIIVTLLDIAILSLLALITVKLYKVKLEYKHCFNMAVYALTLPILLNSVYVLINAFTGFTIQYFQIMYNVISYIYIIAAILIIKTDFNKTGSDVIKIVEELKKEEPEEMPIEEPKEEKKEKKEKEDGSAEPNPSKA